MISVVNHTNGQLSDEDVQVGIRAINRQVAHDFAPYWNILSELRLEGHSGSAPSKLKLPELRGDAVIYLWDRVDVDDALGYHDLNARGIPFGIVFTELSKQLNEEWTVTLSHEALELIGDQDVNLLAMGPHPSAPSKTVFFWYEMCDAVQDESYKVDGIAVSNFLLPLYFTGEAEAGSRNDFLGRLYHGQPLQSFGINPGGYVGFYNPETQQHETYSRKDDRRAQERLAIKAKGQITRRSIRYQLFGKPDFEKAGAMVRGGAAALQLQTAPRPQYALVAAVPGRKKLTADA